MAIKTFTTGEVLTAADTNTYLANSGLVYVASTTFTNSAIPFINGCFNSTYDNYRIILSFVTSNSTNVRWRYRYSTSTTETASQYDRFGFAVTGATVSNLVSTGETSFYFVSTSSIDTFVVPTSMDIFSPNVAKRTISQCQAWDTNTGALNFVNNRMVNNTQYTGLEIFADAGTLTGSIRVYGYRQV